MTRFYLVWSPSGAKPPQYRHPTQALAVAEAERLARANPGHEFFVLPATHRSFQPMSITEPLPLPEGEVDGIPF